MLCQFIYSIKCFSSRFFFYFYLTFNYVYPLNWFILISNSFPCFFRSVLDAFAFVLSRRGKPQLLYRSYLFNSDAIKNGRVYWRCSENRRNGCAARLLTIQDKLIEKYPTHDHPPYAFRVEGKQFISFEECYGFFESGQKLSDDKMKCDVEYLE